MQRTILIDTNIILRFFLNDHEVLSNKARELIQSAENGDVVLYMDEVIVAEIVWVLESFYEISKEEIVEKLLGILMQPWVENPRKSEVIHALHFFKTTSLSYIDTWILSKSLANNFPIETFDIKLSSLAKKLR